MIKQYRWFGENNDLSTVDAVATDFSTGVLFNDLVGKQIVSIGIQATAGSKFYLSSVRLPEDIDLNQEASIGNIPISIIGSTHVYQINFALTGLNFYLGGFAIQTIDNETQGIIIDIIYKDEEVSV